MEPVLDGHYIARSHLVTDPPPKEPFKVFRKSKKKWYCEIMEVSLVSSYDDLFILSIRVNAAMLIKFLRLLLKQSESLQKSLATVIDNE